MKHPDSLSESGDRPDKKTVERVKDVFLFFSHTLSAMKLFPDSNASVVGFRDDLFNRLTDLLDRLTELDIDIEESSFFFEGEAVSLEVNIAKSLPYLFFKDGMQKLIFLRGLDKDELQEFLNVVKTNALLPMDVSDIVDSLWERDFEHIRYIAPDEFLESKIGGRDGTPVLRVDTSGLYEGRVDLTPDDRLDVEKRKRTLVQNGPDGIFEYSGLVAAVDKDDLEQLDALLSAERQLSKEDDFLDTMFELIYLEDRPGPFAEILGFLDRHHNTIVQNADFSGAVRFLTHMEELHRILAGPAPERASAIERLVGEVRDRTDMDELRTLVRNGQVKDIPAFFEYLKKIGPRSLPLAAELFDELSSPENRAVVFRFLEDMAKLDPRPLVPLAQDRKSALTKAIIDILGRLPDRRSVPLLATFMNYENREIRRHAVQTLASFSSDLAAKVVLNFLRDPDEGVRIAATRNIRLSPRDEDLTSQVIKIASEKGFTDKSEAETSEVLNLLGRSRTDTALGYLKSLLERGGLRGRQKAMGVRLCAARALAVMGTPQAIDALRAGARSPHKALREACERALRDVERGPTSAEPGPGVGGEIG